MRSVTKHLADVRLDIHILQMLMCESVVQAERRIQPDWNPDTITNPCQLPHLALLAWVSVKWFLYEGERNITWSPKTKIIMRTSHSLSETRLNLHALGLDHVDLVLVPTPDFVMNHSHASDGVVGSSQIH